MSNFSSVFNGKTILLVCLLFLNLFVIKAQTPCPPTISTGGDNYHVGQFGTRCWTRENLRATVYSDGVAIPVARAYNNDVANVALYGRLYDYYSATRTSAGDPLPDMDDIIQGICPTGWHLPTSGDWNTLTSHEVNTLLSPNGWLEDIGESASEGFNMLPGGFYNSITGRYERMFASGYYWSSSVTTTIPLCAECHCNCPQLTVTDVNPNFCFSVRCVRNPEMPFLTTTAPPVSFNNNSATLAGNISFDGNAPVSDRGIVYSTNSDLPAGTVVSARSTGVGSFSCSISGLIANTTYYYAAYATNSVGTRYGETKSFITLDVPTVSTIAISDTTDHTATSGGNVTFDGHTSITARGICYSSSNHTPTTTDTKIPDASPNVGAFVSYFTGLTPNTTYYVRAYATNSVGTSYGDVVSFTTFIVPTVTLTSVTSVTQDGARMDGSVSFTGNTNLTSRGFCYSSTQTDPSINNSTRVEILGQAGDYNTTLSSLIPNTIYYVRAYATNSVGTSYDNHSPAMSFTTLPSVTTGTISAITTNSTTGGMTIAGGRATLSAGGVCWSTNHNPDVNLATKTTDITTIGTTTSSITGLAANTTYYVRAYATNSAGTSYGNEVSFTTLPSVTTGAISAITTNSANCGMTIVGGNATLSAGGVCWSTSSNPTIDDSKTTNFPTIGTATISIAGLAANTTYYVRAYATNSAGTSYGNEVSFTTLAVPEIATNIPSDITTTAATVGGTITDNTNLALSQHGVCYGTTENPTIDNTKLEISPVGTGTYSSSITLPPNTHYYVRAYATNTAGETFYGTQKDFTTLAVPEIATVEPSVIKTAAATVGGTITNNTNLALSQHGVCYGTTENPTIDNTKLEISPVGTGTYSSSITGLSSNTHYYVRAYATNTAGETFYGTQKDFTTLAVPEIATAIPSAITTTAATVGGTITDNTNLALSQHGVCYGTTENPTIDNTKLEISPVGTGTYSSSITLPPNTHYYVRAYATNSVGETFYGTQKDFTTLAVPEIATVEPSTIKTTAANVGGTITDNTNLALSQHGVCYGTTENPTIDDTKLEISPVSTGTYSSSITGLSSNTHYYVRAYATNTAGETFYGTQKDFTTLSVPNLTATVNNVTNYTATLKCGITASGTPSLTARGVCYKLGDTPSTSDYLISGDGTLSDLSGDIADLAPNSTYSVRAFATNSAGETFYSDPIQFITTNIPTITTANISIYNSNQATVGGKAYGGTLAIIARGVCFGTSPAPVVGSDAKTTLVNAQTTNGDYTDILPGLIPNTKYYVRAYLTNSDGTIYGEEKSFTSTATQCTGIVQVLGNERSSQASTIDSVSDHQNNWYEVIQIGNQCWMRENMKATTSPRGISLSAGAAASDAEAYYYYPDNNSEIVEKYGLLYNWRAIMDTSSTKRDGVYNTEWRGICPQGWHVPTDRDWQILEFTAGMNKTDTNLIGSNRGNIANKLIGGFDWQLSNNPNAPGQYNNSSRNSDAFTALPAGRYNGTINETAQFWGRGFGNAQTYYARTFEYENSSIDRSIVTKDYGLSLRCMRNTLPTITTVGLMDYGTTSVRIKANIDCYGSSNISARGVCYSTSPNPTLESATFISTSAETDSIISNITGLNQGTKYYFRVFASNDAGTSYGKELYYITHSSCPSTPTVTDVDGNVYNTIQIGAQCWMKENLRTTRYQDATEIPLGNTTSSYTEAYRYYIREATDEGDQDIDDPEIVQTYGLLYNWTAVMHGAGSSDLNPSGVQGICPSGWHVPSVAEWEQLRDYVSNQIQNMSNGGVFTISKALASPIGWRSGVSNVVGNMPEYNNVTGFSVLPTGNKFGSSYWHDGADFSSATSYNEDATIAHNFWINGPSPTISINNPGKHYGFAVRCVKD